MFKRIFRWFFISVSVFLLFLALASILAVRYKPQLTAAIHDKIKESINGEFSIDNVSVSIFKDFPQVSVTLEGISLHGVQYDKYKKDFFRAKRVLVNVHLGKLLLKEIDVKSVRIEDADIFVFTAKSGYTNLDIFRKPASVEKDTAGATNPALLSLHSIYLDNVSIAFHDSIKGKRFGVRFIEGKNEFNQTDSSREFHYAGKLAFDRIQFNPEKGGYLTNQIVDARLNGEFIAAKNFLKVQPSSLQLVKSMILLSGGFHFGHDGTFILDIQSDNLMFAEGRDVLPKALADKLLRYDISNPFALKVHIDGKLAPGSDPAVDLSFETHDADVRIDKQSATHVTAKGAFMNHIDDKKEFNDPNSRITVSAFNGQVFGLPVSATASFTNLADPIADIKATLEADAKSLQPEFSADQFKIQAGSITAEVNITGKVNELAASNARGFSGKFYGRTKWNKLQLVWVPRQLQIENLNASMSFTVNKVNIENVSLTVNKSPIVITGSMSGFSPLVTQASKGFVKLNVSSPQVNLETMFPHAPKDTAVHRKQEMKSLSEAIEKLYQSLEFDVTLDIKRLENGKFTATDVNGNLMLKNNQLQANPMRMKLAGGEADIAFGLSDLNKPVNPLWIRASVRRADIREFFHAFNNFNQKTIDHQNLSGTINTNIDVSALLDDDFAVLMPSLAGNVDLVVKEGKLSNFEPLQKMSNFLFKHRDFTDVDFAEIKSSFDLKGTELSISRMEIESSVLSLFLEGRFSLADSTDLIIQLPLSNLKRRDKDYKPKNVGVDSKVGPSVFLRARPDAKGVMGIAYDPFHKFRRSGK